MNAHATSTPLGDAAETKVIKIALGEEHARRTPISSTKGATGHTLRRRGRDRGDLQRAGAARRVLPPTINYEEPDPDCDLDYVPNVAREAPGPQGRGLELVRLRRAQRGARLPPLGRGVEWPHAALGDLRLLRDADRLERRDPRRARARLRRGAGRRAARARTTSSSRSSSTTARCSYREVMTEAMRRLGAPAGEEGGLADSLPALAAVPGGAGRARGGRAAAAGGSRSSRTPTAT